MSCVRVGGSGNRCISVGKGSAPERVPRRKIFDVILFFLFGDGRARSFAPGPGKAEGLLRLVLRRPRSPCQLRIHFLVLLLEPAAQLLDLRVSDDFGEIFRRDWTCVLTIKAKVAAKQHTMTTVTQIATRWTCLASTCSVDL